MQWHSVTYSAVSCEDLKYHNDHLQFAMEHSDKSKKISEL
jgi:hypothetical protein